MKDGYFLVIEGMKVPWTPQCVSGDPAMCSYSHRETIVKSLHHKLDRQDNGQRRDSVGTTPMSPYNVNHVPNHTQ